MAESTVCLADLASVIRSKNAGPFVLTFDVFFKESETFRKVRDAGVITRASLAKLYRVSEDDILEVTFFEPAEALKISIKRWVSSAAPGDTDVFGAQQHVPLMSLSFKLDR
ncbi:MAG: DUF4387 domain-containing protein [Dehalococcoidia bacterium]|nr:MAG: DUF4387 domain-containing protein [Dehalococcoidia bacterium]